MAYIDQDKLFMCGHSLGGWTSLQSTFGDQNVFKATLSFDPAYNAHLEKIMNNEFTCKWPTCVVMSEKFIELVISKKFGYKEMGQTAYEKLQSLCNESVQNPEQNVQFMTIKNCSHMDQGDICMYSQWECSMFNSLIFGIKGSKAEGSQTQFHEFLCCLWLEYLLKIGYHNDTFS
jgi:hypothetical protein